MIRPHKPQMSYKLPSWQGQAGARFIALERKTFTNIVSIEPHEFIPLVVLVSPNGQRFAKKGVR